MCVTETVASRLVDHSPADLGEETVEQTKQCLLDAIGCGIGGYQTGPGKRLVRALSDTPTDDSVTVLDGEGTQVSPSAGVCINGTLINILDMDDTHFGHPGPVMVPAALGLIESCPSDVTGEEFIEAVCLGYELGAAVSAAVKPSAEQREKVFGHGPRLAFGATAIAGKLLGLDEEEFANAFALTGGLAPLPAVAKTSYGVRGPGLLKNNFGAAARAGIEAAFLACEGVQGPIDLFEGDHGFWRMAGSDRNDLDILRDFLVNETDAVSKTVLKPYPMCRHTHLSVSTVVSTVESNTIDVSSIEAMTVRSVPKLAQLPFTNSTPAKMFEAQFSLPFGIAAALLGPPPGPQWFEEDVLHGPQIQSLADRVMIETLPELAGAYPSDQTVEVEIETETKTYSRRTDIPDRSYTDQPQCTPRDPTAWDEVVEKFERITPSEVRIDRGAVVRAIAELDTESSLEPLTESLDPAG
jgi:2-methylcitrate dehydratase PrpD